MVDKLLFEIAEHSRTFDGPEFQAWLPGNAVKPLGQVTHLRLRIFELSDGFSLVSESSNPSFRGGDTWHPTLIDAFAQATSAFGVGVGDWQRVAA